MTLRQTAQLETIGTELAAAPTGSTASIGNKVLAEGGRRSLTDVISELDTAGSTASTAFDSAEGTLSRRQRALGTNLSDADRKVQQRRLGLSRALSTVDARNRQVGAIRKRSDIARSNAFDLRNIVEGQVLSGRGTVAGLEGNRESQFQRERAQYEQSKAEGLGRIAGIGLSFVPGGQFLAPAVGG